MSDKTEIDKKAKNAIIQNVSDYVTISRKIYVLKLFAIINSISTF